MTAKTPYDVHRKATRKKIVASTAVLAGMGAVAGMGAFASFSDSDSATAAVDAGQLGIVVEENFAVADIAAGDIIERPLTIALPDALNDGDLVGAVGLSYSTTHDQPGGDLAGTEPGESLVTGADGLTYELVTCVDGTWTTATTTGAGPYACSGTEVPSADGTLATMATSAAGLTPENFGLGTAATFRTDTTDGADLRLNSLLRLKLPETAGNAYQDAEATIVITGTAIQREGIQK